MTSLSAWARASASLEDAWEAAARLLGDSAFALTTSANSYDLWSHTPTGWLDAGGTAPAERPDVYELRAASPVGEVRWLHVEDGRGRLVALGPDLDPQGEGWTDVPVPTVGEHPVTYLLWGTVAGATADGWAVAGGSRVAPIPVPVAAAEGAVLCLHATEYLGEDDHGNTFVAEELLTHIDELEGGHTGA